MKAAVKRKNCTGCGACQNICPKEAISMCHELEGTYPEIDKEKCVECGLCEKVCPLDKENDDKAGKIYPIVYACRLKDSEILKRSTSGGVFFALAREVISKGGIVFGAVFEADFRVCICAAETEADLLAMQGSKYVESNTQYSFREVEKSLNDGRTCLYTALPCQIAGLLSYLEMHKVNCEKLYTADLVCHGTPSEKLYLSYLDYYQKKKKVRLCGIRHRYKNRCWNSMVPQVCAYVNECKEDVHKSFHDGYLNGFLQGKIYKNNCYECKYASMPRNTDFTLADFTGLGVMGKCKNDYKEGVSQLLINSTKGKAFFEMIKSDLIYEERTLYEALFFNKNLWKPSKKSTETVIIFRDFENGMGWDELRKKYFDRNTKNRLTNFIKELIPTVFGATLTTKVMYYVKKKVMSPDEIIQQLEILFHK